MAIQVSYTGDTGATSAAAYARVERIAIDPREPNADIEVAVYHDEAARQGGRIPVARLSYHVKDVAGSTTVEDFFGDAVLLPLAVSPLRQAYAYLKTLPLFAGGIDA